MSEYKRTVVLVDDNQTSRKFFLRAIENLSVDLKTYGNTDDAIEYLKDNPLRPGLPERKCSFLIISISKLALTANSLHSN